MDELFSEFRDISFKEWKNKANFSLDGRNFNDTLTWNGLEGINIPPYFSPDQKLKSITHFRVNKTKVKIAKYFILKNDTRSIKILENFVNDEFDSIKIFIPKKFNLSQIISIRGLQSKDIQFEFEHFTQEYIKDITNLSENLKTTNKIFLNLDFITRLPVEGNWLTSEADDFDLLNRVLNLGDNIIPIGINTTYYQNSGANIIQQIAYTLSTTVEYADKLGTKIFNKIQYNFAIGSNFYFEVSKIAVFDYLMNIIKEKYKVKTENTICCESSFRNKTMYDAHNNIIRNTTESLISIISGANTIINHSFDSTYNSANKFSSDIAYKQLTTLIEEADISKITNVEEGSYYINFIKHELAEKSLDIFKLIENGGGILKQIKQGIIQRKVNESSKKEQLLFNKTNSSRVYTNEKIDWKIRKYPFLKYKHKETTFRVIYPKRLTEDLEKKRLRDEKQDH